MASEAKPWVRRAAIFTPWIAASLLAMTPAQRDLAPV
jgi:hypothetical protein